MRPYDKGIQSRRSPSFCWQVCSLPRRPAWPRPLRRRLPLKPPERPPNWPRSTNTASRATTTARKPAAQAFEGLTPDSIGEHAELFEKAVRKLRGRVMPPPGSKQPDAKDIDSLVAWLEDSLDRAAGKAHLPDQVVLHRLNRKEYTNAVRDLLAVEFDTAATLPEDDTAEGFDNIATALQVSPSFIEQYVIAARLVAVKAVGRPDARPGGWTFRAGPGTQLTHVEGLPLGTRGGILAKVDLPSDGEYVINIADMVANIWGSGLEYREPGGGDARQQGHLRDRGWRRRRQQVLRSGDERRVGSRQCPLEEHPLLHDRRDRTRSASHSNAGPSPSPTISCRFSRPAVDRIVCTA